MTDDTNHKAKGKAGSADGAPELDELARRYLDLWQDQWTALANDPMVAEAMARGFQMMGPGAAAFANFANLLGQANLYAAAKPQGMDQPGGAPGANAYADPNQAGFGPGGGFGPMPFAGVTPPFARNDNNNASHERSNSTADDGSRDTAPGAAAPGAASAGRDGDMAQLLDRLAAMEQRLADLASALDGTGGDAGATDQPPNKDRRRR